MSIGNCESIPADSKAREKGELVLRALDASKQGIPHPTDWRAVPKGPILAALGVRSWSALKRVTQSCSLDWSEKGYTLTPWRSLGPRSGEVGIEEGKVRLPRDATAQDLGRALEMAFAACDPLPNSARVRRPGSSSKRKSFKASSKRTRRTNKQVRKGKGANMPMIIEDARAMADRIAQALVSSGYAADFSLKSLKEVDRFFEENVTDGKPVADGFLSKQLGARLFAIGSYVGEVVRRQCGGRWQADEANPDSEFNLRLVLDNGSVIWPIQRIMKRFENGAEDALYAYGFAISRSNP